MKTTFEQSSQNTKYMIIITHSSWWIDTVRNTI